MIRRHRDPQPQPAPDACSKVCDPWSGAGDAAEDLRELFEDVYKMFMLLWGMCLFHTSQWVLTWYTKVAWSKYNLFYVIFGYWSRVWWINGYRSYPLELYVSYAWIGARALHFQPQSYERSIMKFQTLRPGRQPSNNLSNNLSKFTNIHQSSTTFINIHQQHLLPSSKIVQAAWSLAKSLPSCTRGSPGSAHNSHDSHNTAEAYQLVAMMVYLAIRFATDVATSFDTVSVYLGRKVKFVIDVKWFHE